MSVRETLNKHRTVATVAMIMLILGAVSSTIWQAMSSGAPKIAAKGWYTTDNGKTWFTDEIYKSTPFDHNGQQAYGAAVFKCGDGQPFVPYVTRLSTKFLKDAQALEANNDANFGPKFEAIQMQGLEVSKAGTDKWYPAAGPAGERITSGGMKCPGGGTVEPVMP